MGDRIIRIAVMSEAADEADAFCYSIAFAATDDRLARSRRPQIVDPEVERRLVAEHAQPDPDGDAGRHVHQADNRARRYDPAFRYSDQLFGVRQAEFGPILAMVMI